MFRSYYPLIWLMVCASFAMPLNAQSYYTNGTATSIGNSCYQLTRAANNQNGSVWYADKIDLTKDLDLEFTLNFGSKDDGADGIVFVMQTVGTSALGNNGGGIGFEGFSPSLGVEFDTYQNTEMGDLSADHIGILKHGSINHNSNNSIAGPISASPSSANIEDNKNYPVRIVYRPGSHLFQVWFDCSLRLQTTINLSKDIFSGKTEVFWGFTSATGGRNNIQIACLSDNIIISDTLSICKGQSVKLSARPSKNNAYTWTPSSTLSNAGVQNPVASPQTTTRYMVEARDVCDKPFVDTVLVEVSEPFSLDIGEDSLLCDGASYPVVVPSDFDKVQWSDGFGLYNRTLKNAGTYRVTAWRGECSNSDTLVITTNQTPQVSIQGNPKFCSGDSTLLLAEVKPDGQSFQWDNGSSLAQRIVKSWGPIVLTASNQCGSHSAQVMVEEIFIEKPDLGMDTMLCEGEALSVQLTSDPSIDVKWNDGRDDRNRMLTDDGTYEVRYSKGACHSEDTITVGIRYAPVLNLPAEYLLCRGFRKTMESGVSDGIVTWNGLPSRNLELYNFEGLLTVRAENPCGADSMDVIVSLEECYCDLYFPNAITVNRDDLNETFGPQINCQYLLDYELFVYDRWGEQIFATTSSEERWDGKIVGNDVPLGLHFFVVRYTGIVNGYPKKHEQYGTITVLR